MDVLALIHSAQGAGLRLGADGTALKTGPKEAEPLARLLGEHKAEVLAVLVNDELRKLRKLREIAPGSPQGDLPQSVEQDKSTMTPPTDPRWQFSAPNVRPTSPRIAGGRQSPTRRH
jgi:hypothetical protein